MVRNYIKDEWSVDKGWRDGGLINRGWVEDEWTMSGEWLNNGWMMNRI